MIKDGTMAVEAFLGNTLVQWPFLTDLSLIWAAASIFLPPKPEEGETPDPAAKVPNIWLLVVLMEWNGMQQ